jgi:hypothetical protein
MSDRSLMYILVGLGHLPDLFVERHVRNPGGRDEVAGIA